jgi:O-antigen/teichoic acid export membrane protein
MTFAAQVTFRNVGSLLIQRGGIVISLIIFATLVPRLMGPEIYGQYTLLTSLALWITYGSAFGITPIMGRFVPKFLIEEDRKGLLKFVGQMASTRLLIGGIGTALYFTLTVFWLQELDWVALVFMAMSVFFHIISFYIFALFLGLNQAAKWAMHETLKCWGTLILVLAGVFVWGLKGACLGFALTDFIVLAVGLKWGKTHLGESLSWPDLLYLAPFFSFGLLFFVADIIMATLQYSGATLITLVTQDYTQVSYFGLAYQGYMMVVVFFNQFAMAFAPFLAGLQARQDPLAIKYWVEQLLKWLAIGSILIAFGALFLADALVPLLLGEAFRPVALNLVIMTLSLLAQGVISVGAVLTIVKERPGVYLGSSALRLISFLVAGGVLAYWRGSLGASLAVIVGAGLQAGYYMTRWRGLVPVSWRSSLQAVGLGALFVPLVWLKSSWSMNVGLAIFAMVAYLGGLLVLRLVTPGELAQGWKAMVSRQVPQSSSSVENQ